MKICKKCLVEQPLSAFHKSKKNRGGVVTECKPCRAVRKKLWRGQNRNKANADNTSWNQNNKEYKHKHYLANKEKYASKSKKVNKEKKDAYNKQYVLDNQDRYNYLAAKRRAKKLSATPKWLTLDHFREIQEFYTIAKELSWLSESPLVVDHITPLQGKEVSGLHVPWNLQILTEHENCKKSNKVKGI